MSLSYYGISFSIPDLSGDRYLNFMIGGGIELAAYIMAFVFVNSFGRKIPLMMYLMLSGTLCISVVCVRHFVSGMLIFFSYSGAQNKQNNCCFSYKIPIAVAREGRKLPKHYVKFTNFP